MNINSNIKTAFLILILTTIIYQPAILTAHRVLLFDDSHYVPLQYGHIQILCSVKVPFSLEEFLWAVDSK